jgi:hypothetical protein
MNIENMRNMQYIALENNLKTAAHLISLFPTKDLTSYRDGGTGWTATEVFCHLRDFEALFLERATLTVSQEMPDLPFPKPNRAKLLAFFKERPEADWERVAMHPVRGKLSLHDQLVITPQHDTIHFEQFTRILAEKKS